MSLNDTPKANRLHIGIYGKRNSGKSSLINAITNQNISVVSNILGTTTDPVYKSMEISTLGPCVWIDTAGFDDDGEIGDLRVERTKETIEKIDIAIIVFDDIKNYDKEKKWIELLKEKNIPIVAVLNKIDILENPEYISSNISKNLNNEVIKISSKEKIGINKIIEEIVRKIPADYDVKYITENIVKDNDTVLLVMPQDIQAPKGRLILPQVQTIRELLDRKCVVVSTTLSTLEKSLQTMKLPPDVIITDSQIFKTVYEKKPIESKLTSFSVLFAAYKGDIDYYVQSVHTIDNLTESSKVLIAESCTHAPLEEDIGRVKIPNMLRKKIGENLKIDIVSGADFPEKLDEYSLIIQCGGCMFNKKYMLSRIEKAKKSNIPMTNYGVTIAYISGILNKISFN